MEIRQLEVFCAVAEQGSFSKAALSLGLSQSTVSTHIKNLEQELRRSLIRRTTKRLSLTEDGNRLLPYARRILESRDAALDELERTSEQLLHLGASTIPSGYLLPKLLGEFHALHPGVFYALRRGDSREIQELVLNGEVELGFVGSLPPAEHCVSIPFCRDSMVLATPVTEHYQRLRREACGLLRLLQEPIILREQGSGTQKAADEFLSAQGISREMLHPIAELNDPESIKQLIVAGMGVTIGSRFAFADLEAQGQAILYPLPAGVHRTFYITHLRSRTLKPVHRALIRYVLSAMGMAPAAP